MRIRTIKPEFWAHPVMSRQDDAAKLLAIGLLNYADDEGFFYADARLIRAALRPFDEDSSNVRRSLEDLSKIDFIELREHSTHGAVGRVVSFDTHQRVDRPSASKIKPFYESADTSQKPRSPNIRRTLDDQSSLEGNREQGKEGKGKDQSPSAPPPVTPAPIPLALEPVPQPPAAAPSITADDVYDAYPRKVARADAVKAIERAARQLDKAGPLDGHEDGLSYLLDRARTFAEAVSRWPEDDKRFIPHPATWFNRASYDDDPATWERIPAGHGGNPFQMPKHDHSKGF